MRIGRYEHEREHKSNFIDGLTLGTLRSFLIFRANQSGRDHELGLTGGEAALKGLGAAITIGVISLSAEKIAGVGHEAGMLSLIVLIINSYLHHRRQSGHPA